VVREEGFVSLVDGGELDWEFHKALGLVKALVVVRVGIGLDRIGSLVNSLAKGGWMIESIVQLNNRRSNF
jgi:hypothetical protein